MTTRGREGSGWDEPLAHRPNLGPKAVAALRRAGVTTPELLTSLGSVETAARMLEMGAVEDVCRSRLYALEGAIRHVRWHRIPKEERDRLWQEFMARIGRDS